MNRRLTDLAVRLVVCNVIAWAVCYLAGTGVLHSIYAA